MDQDFSALARTLASALDLPVAEENLPEVARNLAIAHRMAANLLAFDLPDTIEAAPVFDPLASAAETTP